MRKIRVLLVDDHTVVRQGLRRILETDEEIEIVGETGDGRSAADMAQRLHPNVVVMDIALPELNGIEATRQIMKRNEGAKVLILTMHSDDVCVRQSLKAGARGYLLKDSEDLDLQSGRLEGAARGLPRRLGRAGRRGQPRAAHGSRARGAAADRRGKDQQR